jgi:hypothetical protein
MPGNRSFESNHAHCEYPVFRIMAEWPPLLLSPVKRASRLLRAADYKGKLQERKFRRYEVSGSRYFSCANTEARAFEVGKVLKVSVRLQTRLEIPESWNHMLSGWYERRTGGNRFARYARNDNQKSKNKGDCTK